MADSRSGCARGFARPSSSRISRFALAPLASLAREAFGGAKGEAEDAEMRRAGRIIRVCGGRASAI
jgi:hypothetical protein